MSIVVALGGNALQSPGRKSTYKEYATTVRDACRQIAPAAAGSEILMVHGNGTEVGNLLLEEEMTKIQPLLPLDVVVAETQGQIGYMLASGMENEMARLGIRKKAICVVTRVAVSGKDAAFSRPSKPVGPLYSESEYRRLKKSGADFMKVGSGYRRVVPSPRPLDIIERKEIIALLKRNVVIACGGGGVPVIKKKGMLEGVEAVIDKDHAAALAARLVGARRLVMLTDVEGVFTGYGTKRQILLRKMTIRDAERRIEAGEFGEGSMKPKVEAAIDFVKGGGSCVIAHLKYAAGAVEGKAGTRIVG